MLLLSMRVLASTFVVATLATVDCFSRSSPTTTIASWQKRRKRLGSDRNAAFSLAAAPSGEPPPCRALGAPICVYRQVDVPSSEANPVPRQAISVEDLTPTLRALLEESGMVDGLITVISRHTTTSLAINEWESRLADDVADALLRLMPPDERSASPAAREGVTYKHNDIHLRPFGDNEDGDGGNADSEEARRCRENGWDVDDPAQLQAWRDQEPINAHSHLLSMLAGSSSESIPVVDGQMVLGQWQSVLLLDLDGPRDRTVGVQLMGYS